MLTSDGITDSMDMGFNKLRERVKDSQGYIHGAAKSAMRLSDWTTERLVKSSLFELDHLRGGLV